jgi:NAD(P)-dependent dehydrogenase (short-subunit alcohol dehydrogenase family)
MKPVAVITGAANNIGLAIANQFSQHYQVVGLDRAFQKQDQHSINADDQIQKISCDITNPDEVASALKIARALGPIKALVNSAAITEPRASILDTSIESWRKLMDINLTGAFIVMKTAIPYLQESKGVGLLITSRAGKVGYAGFDPNPAGTKAHYCASKAGVISLVKSLAIELAPFGVRVNGLAPGSIEGTMIPKELWAGLSEKIPLKRLGLPEEIAQAASFLCSDASSYITGHILDVNGGTLMD